MTGPAVTVVVATRDRRARLLATLDALTALPEAPPVVVVDNGSSDGTAAAVRDRGGVELVALPRNRGAVARTVGAVRARTPYVAFADDDSHWTPGSLARAVAALDAHPRVGLVVGRVELAGGGTDPVSRKHALAVLGRPAGLPGPPVLSAPAFAMVLRRELFEAVGGFSRLLFFGGEEQLLITDLAAAGHACVHLDDVVAVHAPAGGPVSARRWALQERNDVLVRWLRWSWSAALGATADLARRAVRDRGARRALLGVVVRLPAALAQRRRVPPALEHDLRRAARPATELAREAARAG